MEYIGISYDDINQRWIWTNGNHGYPSTLDRFSWQQKRLWQQDFVHFELGGTSDNAINETLSSSHQNLIDMVCCVGPDDIYQQPFPNPTVFGVFASSNKYTQQLVLSLAIQGAKTIAITYSDAPFTSTTCLAAKNYAIKQASHKYQLVYEYKYSNTWESITLDTNGNPDYTANPVFNYQSNQYTDLKNMLIDLALTKPDVWIHCGYLKSGIFGLKTLDNIGYRPKAILQTIAPNSIQTYMNNVGELGHYVFGVAQWHPAMTFQDTFFGTAAQYSKSFQQYTGIQAEYIGAGASATGYILGTAIQSFYSTRLHTVGLFDTKGIITTLRGLSMETFFGDVEFNAFQRNIAKEPATLQNLPDSSHPYGINQACVLPIAFANAPLVYPDPRSISATSSSTNNIFLLYQVIAYVIGSVLVIVLIIIGISVYRGYNKKHDIRAVRIERLSKYPVHRCLLEMASSVAILSAIETNIEIVNLNDVDGKTGRYSFFI
jgi:hypothetical protein